MKRLFLLLVMGLTLTVPCAFADDDEEIPQTPPPSSIDDENRENKGFCYDDEFAFIMID